MNTVIKKMFAVLLLLTAFSAWAQEGNPVEEMSIPAVDLSVTITELARAANDGGGPEAGTAVILNGTVIERAVINSEEANFSAELMMASGEWVGATRVEISKCIILLNGSQYSDMIPARRSRTVNPKEITLNCELLVYGMFIGYAETGEGLIAVIEAGGVRKL